MLPTLPSAKGFGCRDLDGVLCCRQVCDAVLRTCLFVALKVVEKQAEKLLVPGWHSAFHKQKVRKSLQQPWRTAERGCGRETC